MKSASPSARLKCSDGIFCGLLLLLCSGLTVLQYHWTGMIADAEMARLRGNLAGQSRALGRAFDTELNEATAELGSRTAPSGSAMVEARQLARIQAWRAADPRPIFGRFGLAEAEAGEAGLLLFDEKSGEFLHADWPQEWSALRENLREKHGGRAPPFVDEQGLLWEFPLQPEPGAPGEGPLRSPRDFDRGAGGPPREGPPDFTRNAGTRAWFIAELDLNYAKTTWLPELAARYFDADGQELNLVRVRTLGHPSAVLYASPGAEGAIGRDAVTVRFNAHGRPGPGPRGPGENGAWLLEAWPRAGALDAVVAASRHRNLAVAGILNLLILCTGVALIQHTRRARQLAESQMNFVANISHELRTPLTVIRGAAHNLQRGVVHERTQIESYSTLILQHTSQLTEMIEQLIELASRRQNPSPPALHPASLAEVLQSAVAASRSEAEAAGCALVLDLPETLPPIMADAAALRRVFQNLIANAAKHGGTGGWIGVTAAVKATGEARSIEVRVADRGLGIPADEQKEIFQPFVRGARAQAGQIRGSGLGLSLVREIVALHQGTIAVESSVNQGATFIVRLPALSPSAA